CNRMQCGRGRQGPGAGDRRNDAGRCRPGQPGCASRFPLRSSPVSYAVNIVTGPGRATRARTFAATRSKPHYQSLDYNRPQRGIARWFEPIRPAVAVGPTMQTILSFGRLLFGSVTPETV